MRFVLLVVLAATACTDDVTFGQVQAIEDGSGRITVRACLDAQLFSCGGEDVVLEASHDGSAGTLKYAGIFFPEHVGSVELGSPDASIVVADGDARVEMGLPPAFELTTERSGDEIQLRWVGADEPMVWIAQGTCDTRPTYPGSPIETIDDDGAFSVTVARLEQLMERSLAGCDVDIELSRVREGSVDAAFRADSATGIVRRTARVTID